MTIQTTTPEVLQKQESVILLNTVQRNHEGKPKVTATFIQVQAVEVVGKRKVTPLAMIRQIQYCRKMAGKDGASRDKCKEAQNSKATGADTSKERSKWILRMKENSGLIQDTVVVEVTRKTSGTRKWNIRGTARKQKTDMNN